MLSGGMDSTYLAWKLLSEKTEGVHLHHISMRTVNTRWIKEDECVNQIINYFKNKSYLFEYSQSIFQFEGHYRVGFDSDTLLLVGQKLAQNAIKANEKVDLILGWNPHDIERPDIAERMTRHVTGNVWKALVESAWNREHINKELQFPLIEQNITKDIMFNEMPKELIDMTWSCRRDNDTPCGNCHACLEIKLALNNQ